MRFRLSLRCGEKVVALGWRALFMFGNLLGSFEVNPKFRLLVDPLPQGDVNWNLQKNFCFLNQSDRTARLSAPVVDAAGLNSCYIP
jgi:hypothetical protein